MSVCLKTIYTMSAVLYLESTLYTIRVVKKRIICAGSKVGQSSIINTYDNIINKRRMLCLKTSRIQVGSRQIST